MMNLSFRLYFIALAFVMFVCKSGWSQASQYSLSYSIGTFTSISSTGTPLAITGGGGAFSAAIPIGFTFNFEGMPQTMFKASEDGYITFNTSATATASSNDLDNTPAGNRPLIAPLWDDQEGKQAFYQIRGLSPNRTMIIEWYNWEWSVSAVSPIISYQILLHEGTDVIDFHYQHASLTAPVSASASIGLCGVTTFLSLQDAGLTPMTSNTIENSGIDMKPATGLLYTFSPAPCPPSTSVTISNITTTTIDVSWTTGGAANWNLEYGPSGFSLGTGTRLNNVSNPYTITGLTPGTAYDVYIQDSCSTTDVSSWTTATSTSTLPLLPSGISELGNKGLIVYPNPSHGQLTFEVNMDRISDVEVSLMDVSGQNVYHHVFTNLPVGSSKVIDVSSLKSGLYILRVNSERGPLYKRITIK